MSCKSCVIALTTEQWGACECPVWDCCGDIREIKTSVNVLAVPPTVATAADYAPGTVLVTTDGVAWTAPANAAAVAAAVAIGVVVCAPIHVVGQAYPAVMEIVLRTAETGVYDEHLLFPVAFTPADVSLALAAMQSKGFKRRAHYA